MVRRYSEFSQTLRIACAIASGFSNCSTKQALTSFSKYSFIGAMSDVTMAAPQAAASINTIPTPSHRLGVHMQAAQEYHSGSSEFWTDLRQKQRFSTPLRCANL